MKKKTIIMMLVLILVAIVVASATYGGLKPVSKKVGASALQSTAATEKKSNPIAPDFKLKDLKGNNVRLSDYRGKIVLLNFWAVWCKYCKQEMPDLNELNKLMKKSGDAVILAIDVQEDSSTVETYLKEKKLEMNVLYDGDGAVASMYEVTGYPTTFVINPDGTLYTYIPGMTNKETLMEIIKTMKSDK